MEHWSVIPNNIKNCGAIFRVALKLYLLLLALQWDDNENGSCLPDPMPDKWECVGAEHLERFFHLSLTGTEI
jgi:hypothetical protein